jgi:hypothetical protein
MTKYIQEVCNFEQRMYDIHPKHCIICHQRRLIMNVNKNNMCKRCSIEKHGIHKFSHDNRALPTWINEFGEVQFSLPYILQYLTIAECLLIQQISPLIPLIHIKNGTLGSRGNIVSFNQDISGICMEFPRLPNDITVVKVIRSYVTKTGHNIHKSFIVNRYRIISALYWLQHHSISYKDIIIKVTNLSWMNGQKEANIQHVIEVTSKETEPEDMDR